MKKIMLMSIIVGIFLIGAVLFYRSNIVSILPAKYNSGAKCHSIAILTPVTHQSLEQIQAGFINTLRSEGKDQYSCDVYNANGNKRLMHAQIEEILQKKYDLIFALGAHAAQMAKEITTKKQVIVPIVFGAVADPEGINLIDNPECSGNHVVGAIEVTDYDKQLSVLRRLIPNLKRILLVYDPTQGVGLEKDKETIEALLNQQGVSLVCAEIYGAHEVYSKVEALCQEDVDALLILKDNTAVSAIGILVKFCNQQKIPLMATDLDSVEKGAACAFGVHEYDYGLVGAHLAQQVLEERCAPASLKSQPVDMFNVCINPFALQRQGIQQYDADEKLESMDIEVIIHEKHDKDISCCKQ